ncbi:DMT family transporter [Chthonobacter rhizosphaerae]|uniref:DMT family transporter n=1 Tax=Chthonobacter rhizosphaerae TaxID=2735553 RepID=UPI0015EEE44B|nr:DMT family transporter [Chthonobacter rhizosphaerae]
MSLPHTAARPSPLASAYGALVLGAVAMGVSPVMVRLADVGPYASAFWRVGLALPILYLWARSEAGNAAIAAALRTPAVLIAGLLFAGDLFFWHLAIVNTTVANATFLATTAPIWVVLGSWALIGERVERQVMVGLALCVAGGAVLLGGSYSLAPERIWGDLYGIVTSLFFGGYFLALRVARRTVASGAATFASTVVTAPVLLAVAAVLEPTLWPASLGGVAALFGLAFISHAGGQGLLAFALGHLPAAFSSLVIFLEAVAAALIAWLVLGETLGLEQAIGGSLILGGIVIARPRA